MAMDIRDIPDQGERRRILDFVTGMAFMSNATIRSINRDGVFLLRPSNSSRSTEERERLQQLGLYIYSKEALNLFSKLPSLSLEKSEQVELLRFLEHGYSVEMTKVRDVGLSVDIPEDIKLVEDYLNKLQK